MSCVRARRRDESDFVLHVVVLADLVRRLDGHQGFVKGVVFDPVGQYLATQVSRRSFAAMVERRR